MALFCSHKHSKNTTENALFADGSHDNPHADARTIPAIWKRLFRPSRSKLHPHWVPSLSGILKAGDEGFYSSTLFTSLHEHSGQLSYKSLLDAFARDLRARPSTDRCAYSREISEFLSINRGSSGGGGGDGVARIARSQSYKDRSDARRNSTSRSRRKSMDSWTVERGLGRSMSIKRPALVPISMSTGLANEDRPGVVSGSWMKDGTFAEAHGGAAGVRVTPLELTALSLVLGCPLNITNSRTKVTSLNQGALGISIESEVTEVGECQVVLHAHERSITQLPASGSGFSPLFAKHFAFGSLPFSQDAKTLRSLLITDKTVEVIQAGCSFSLQPSSQQTLQSKYLALLPHSRELSLYIVSSSCTATPPATLINAIASLPFTGGLTPLASSPLVAAVRFVASRGLPPGRLIPRLEGLIDKVHKHARQLHIFGPLYEPHNASLLFRERERLGKRAARAAPNDDPLANKVARMHRYTSLLEHLMALIPTTKSQHTLAAVHEAANKEMQHSYADAVTAHRGTLSEISFTVESQRDARKPSTGSTWTAGRGSDVSPAHSLGQEMEQILKMGLPLSFEAVAVVARMVLVAWTMSVEIIAWDVGEEGYRLPALGSLPDTMVLR